MPDTKQRIPWWRLHRPWEEETQEELERYLGRETPPWETGQAPPAPPSPPPATLPPLSQLHRSAPTSELGQLTPETIQARREQARLKTEEGQPPVLTTPPPPPPGRPMPVPGAVEGLAPVLRGIGGFVGEAGQEFGRTVKGMVGGVRAGQPYQALEAASWAQMVGRAAAMYMPPDEWDNLISAVAFAVPPAGMATGGLPAAIREAKAIARAIRASPQAVGKAAEAVKPILAGERGGLGKKPIKPPAAAPRAKPAVPSVAPEAVVPGVPKAAGMALEPWQMTRKERLAQYAEEIRQQAPSQRATYRASLGVDHKTAVREALSEGKPVPPEVLADYPELVRVGRPAPEVRKTFEVTVTQGTIKPKGGVEVPLERTFTVSAKTAQAAVKSVRDAGIRADKVTVREVTKRAIPKAEVAGRAEVAEVAPMPPADSVEYIQGRLDVAQRELARLKLAAKGEVSGTGPIHQQLLETNKRVKGLALRLNALKKIVAPPKPLTPAPVGRAEVAVPGAPLPVTQTQRIQAMVRAAQDTTLERQLRISQKTMRDSTKPAAERAFHQETVDEIKREMNRRQAQIGQAVTAAKPPVMAASPFDELTIGEGMAIKEKVRASPEWAIIRKELEARRGQGPLSVEEARAFRERFEALENKPTEALLKAKRAAKPPEVVSPVKPPPIAPAAAEAPAVIGKPPLVKPPTPPGQPPVKPPPTGPTLPGIPPAAPSEDPVAKLTRLIKEMKPLRRETEALYHQERQVRAARISAAIEKGQGEKTLFEALGELKGELPKPRFEAPGGQFTEAEIGELFNRIWKVPTAKLQSYEKVATAQAFRNLLVAGKIPTRSEIAHLEGVFGSDLVKALLSKRSLGEKSWELFLDVAGLPKALRASVDLSAPFRQGLLLINEGAWWRAWGPMLKAGVSEKAAIQFAEEIAASPLRAVAREAGLYIAPYGKVGARLAAREEMFFSRLAQKIPWVRISERTYVTFLNKLRWGIFTRKAEQILAQGGSKEELKPLAQWINAASGRGDLPRMGESLQALVNAGFFAPRFLTGRLQAVGIAVAPGTPTEVRRLAAKNLVLVVSEGLAALSLAALAGAKVEKDPRSPDFGKINIGETRIDIWGGYQQLARYTTQMIMGQRKTIAGEIQPTPRSEIAGRFVESKESPTGGLATSLFRGRDFMGYPMGLNMETLKRALVDLGLPLAPQDLIEAVWEHGIEGVGLAMPAMVGMGVQTYGQGIEERIAPVRMPFQEKAKYRVGEPLAAELKRLEVSSGRVTAVIAGKKLTPEERDRYQETTDTLMLAILPRMLSKRTYQKLSDDNKKWAIERLMSASREEARGIVTGKLTEKGSQSRLKQEMNDTLEAAKERRPKKTPYWGK